MDYANYKNDQSKYPVSVETFDFIQEQIKFVMKLTGMAGKNVILQDCDATKEGLVIVNGELYELERGYPNPDGYITIHSKPEAITAKGVVYNGARVRMYARYISYPGGYPVSDFIKVKNLTELTASLQHHVPKGTIIDWYGEASCDNIPYGWVPCGGFFKTSTAGNAGVTPNAIIEELKKWSTYYPDIESEYKHSSNGGSTYCGLVIKKVNGVFIPNLSGRFIVGAGISGITSIGDYVIDEIGGEKAHKLTAEESGLPEHTHTVSGPLGYSGENGIAGCNWYLGSEQSFTTSTAKKRCCCCSRKPSTLLCVIQTNKSHLNSV